MEGEAAVDAPAGWITGQFEEPLYWLGCVADVFCVVGAFAGGHGALLAAPGHCGGCTVFGFVGGTAGALPKPYAGGCGAMFGVLSGGICQLVDALAGEVEPAHGDAGAIDSGWPQCAGGDDGGCGLCGIASTGVAKLRSLAHVAGMLNVFVAPDAGGWAAGCPVVGIGAG